MDSRHYNCCSLWMLDGCSFIIVPDCTLENESMLNVVISTASVSQFSSSIWGQRLIGLNWLFYLPTGSPLRGKNLWNRKLIWSGLMCTYTDQTSNFDATSYQDTALFTIIGLVLTRQSWEMASSCSWTRPGAGAVTASSFRVETGESTKNAS